MAAVELSMLFTSEFHQRCKMSLDIFRTLSANVGSFVEIRINNKAHICSAWPEQMYASSSIILNDSVTSCNFTNLRNLCDSENIKMISKNNDKLQTESLSANVPEKDENIIQVLNTTNAHEVLLDVVFQKPEKVNACKRNRGFLKQIEAYCQSLLLRFCVKESFIVNCQASRLAQSYGISDIIINQCKSDNNVSDDTGFIINKNTKVTVETVHSKEWFNEMTRIKLKLNKPGGLDNVINMLLDLIKLPLQQKDKFRKLGANPPRGILLYGPPGCGKTSLVKYVCAVNDIFLVTINGPEIFGPLPGETEANLRQVFEKVTVMSEEGPCILFIDEIDSLCPARREGAGNVNETRATAQFLTLMDDLSPGDNILVIGATNRPAALDPSLRRPGRLDREVVINPPNQQQRLEILMTHMKDIPRCSDVDVEHLAEVTNGYVGADLASLCHEAAYLAMSETTAGNFTMVNQGHFDAAVKKIQPSLQRGAEGVVDLRPVNWNNIGGLDTVKKQIKQAVEWPLQYPQAFERMGLKPPRGVLLYGPPGCCKTTLVRAAATSCHSTFLSLSGAQLYSPYVGDSERLIAEVFQKARACAPSILFLDELDSIVGKRSESGQRGVQERILSTLLNEMDGIGVRLGEGTALISQQKILEGQSASIADGQTGDKTMDNRSVLVVAATNRPDLIDDALMRPGRMDRIIYVQHPDTQARRDILELYTRDMQLQNCDLDLLAKRTDMYTGADLESLCREAALFALTENIETRTVCQEHFEKAIKSVPASLNPQLIEKYSSAAESMNTRKFRGGKG